jgi:hypothetical protein
MINQLDGKKTCFDKQDPVLDKFSQKYLKKLLNYTSFKFSFIDKNSTKIFIINDLKINLKFRF